MNPINFTKFKFCLFLTLFSLVFGVGLSAQVTEAFTGESGTSFSEGAVTFSCATGFFSVQNFSGYGSNGFGDDYYLEASSVPSGGSAGTIELTSGGAFQLSDLDLWLSTSASGGSSPDDGNVDFIGTLFSGGTVTATIFVDFLPNPPSQPGWTNVSFSGTALDGVNLTKVEVDLDAGYQYCAIDDFRYTQLDPNAVNVTINDVTLAEGNSGNTAFNFTVARSNNNTAFSLNAATANGSASAGTDFTSLSTTVNFTMGGALTQTVTVNVLGQVDPEPDEDFFVNLSILSGTPTLLDPQGKGIILDDDTICEDFEGESGMAFSDPTYGYSWTTDVMTIGTLGGNSGTNYIDHTFPGNTGGSAGEIILGTAGKVFQILNVHAYLSEDANHSYNGTVTFVGTKPDNSTVSHPFVITGQNGMGFNWTLLDFTSTPFDGVDLTKVEVTISSSLNYVALDDFCYGIFDATAIAFSIDDVSMNEGNAGPTTFQFTVSRNNSTTANNVTVQSAVGGPTPATPGTDYTALGATTLMFPIGTATQTVDVIVSGDTDAEFPETFLMNLSSPTNGATLADGSGLGTIKDDDTVCETFEDEASIGAQMFAEGGVDFTSTMELITGFFAGGGGQGSSYYLESDINNLDHSGIVGSINLTTANTAINLIRFDFWLSNCDPTPGDPCDNSNTGTLRLTGTVAGGGTVTHDFAGIATGGNWNENISFAGTPFDGVDITALQVELVEAAIDYVALDNICFDVVSLCGTPPTVNFTAPADLCVDAGVQAGLGGGTPPQGSSPGDQGIYSGTGVTDDGNGMTYSFDPVAAGVGVHTLTYTYIENNGCSTSATDNIEVFALPTITFTALPNLCVDSGVQTGLGGGSPPGGVYSGAGVTDNNNGTTYSFDPAAAGVGTHTITYTYTDTNGCTNSASDDVEVFALPNVFFTAPADLCINAGVQAGLGGGGPLGGVYSGAGVTDDGNGMTYSFDPAAAGVGTHTITYTYTDTNGCTNSASDDVEVLAIPNVAFTALADLCIVAGVQAGLGGGTPMGGFYSGAGVTDDANGMTYSFDPAAAGVGTHTITYTVGVAGCIGSASDDVEVFALPVVTFNIPASQDTFCIDAPVEASIGGGLPTGGVYSGPGVTDNGNGMNFAFETASAGLGLHIISYTFTDVNGCTNSDDDFVYVVPLPSVTFTALSDLCIDAGVQAGLGGGTPTGGDYSGAGVTDDGNGMTYSFDPAAAGVGTHAITYTYTDANGCTNSASDDVEVFALPNATLTITPVPDVCQDDPVVTGLGGGQPTGGVYSGPGVTDDGNGTTFSFDPNPPGGNVTVTYSFTDANGCSDSATDVIFVDPVCCEFTATCPANKDLGSFNCNTLGNIPALPTNQTEAAAAPYSIIFGSNPCGTILVDAYDDTTPDVCGGNIQTINRTVFIWDDLSGGTPGVFDAGTEDSQTCTYTYTVNPDGAPTAVCPANISDVVLNANGNGTLPANIGDGSSTDDCGNPTETSPTASFTCADIGSQTVTLTATDACNNTNTATCSFNVVDNTDPDITCPANVTKECDQSTSSIWTGTATATDNCTASPTISESDASTQGTSGCSYYSYTITRTWTADDGNGNTASCDQVITVDDSTGPSITCPANVTIECDESSLPANTGTATAVDNCDTAPAITSSDAITPGSCANEWTITRTWTATDACGNASSCDQVITVDDSTAPDITCPANVTVECSGDHSSAVNGVATATDNCSAAGDITIGESDTNTPGSCANEWTITRTWTATDECGKSSSCDQTINVEDSTGPDITCPANVTVECDADNTSAATGMATALDNCDAAPSISESDVTTPGSCANEWTITRTWTATDACGNTSSCDQVITVDDSTAPDMECGSLTVTPNADGTYTLSQNEIDGLGAGSTDNCGTVAFSASPNWFNCADEGANTVTVTGTDDCGNTATCSATVTVEAYLAIASCTATDETCQGAGDGTITISATALGGQVKYSVDGGANFTASGSFTNLSPGTYNIVVKVFGIAEICEKTDSKTVGAGNPATTWYKDADGDGYSDGNTLTSCTQPSGYISNPNAGTDCNDGNADIYPGAPELCDGLDNDCDGIVPADEADADGDGYRICGGDCDDTDASVNPGATEICNGIDDDCDGLVDEGISGGQTYTGNVTFVTQADVDAWMACYSVIDGNLTIAGYNITDLSNLINLVEVTGTVSIYYNSVLATLDGLDNLATVGGSLTIFYNFLLSDCCAIHTLINGGVSGAISIFFNATGCNSTAEINSNCGNPLMSGPKKDTDNAEQFQIATSKTASQPSLVLFPNPASDLLTVQVNGASRTGSSLSISDNIGRTVLVGNAMYSEDGNYKINIANLPNGVYNLVWKMDDGAVITKRFVKIAN